MAYIDAYQFLSRVNVPMMYVIGTNDNLFNSFDDHGFYPFYHPNYVSVMYPVAVGGVLMLVGLFLLNRYHRDILDK